MKTIAVINYKGGVGKTTLTANIAADLAARGKNILMVDLDPQASLTFSFIDVDIWKKNYQEEKTIKNWFDSLIYEEKKPSFDSLIVTPDRVNEQLNSLSREHGNLDLICSNLSLINVDLELASILGGSNKKQISQNYIKVHSHLEIGLKDLFDSKYDYCLIDCPPNFNLVTRAAIIASDHIIVPAIPDYLSTFGIYELKYNMDNLIQNYNEYFDHARTKYKLGKCETKVIGVAFNLIELHAGEPISSQKPHIDEIRNSKFPMFNSFIRKNSTYTADGANNRIPVVIANIQIDMARTVVKEFNSLTDEILGAIK